MKLTEPQLISLFKQLTGIGISLSAEKNYDRLLEIILIKAKDMTHADGGTIYTLTEENTLKFEIMMTSSLGIHIGALSHEKNTFDDLPLFDTEGNPNTHMIATSAALSDKTIVINDEYTNEQYDLSSSKMFDKKTGYHTKSLLTVPMTNHLNEVIGVLQLVNRLEPGTNKLIPFSKLDQHIVESLASQAAVIITNRTLSTAQKQLFDSLIQLIAKTIDEKSHETANHCRRVPIITKMLAEATCHIDIGPLKDFNMTEDEKYELEVAAWLHDCGKITTPEAVVNKATKLQGIIDGIELIDTRFEVLKRDAIIDALVTKLKQVTDKDINSLDDEVVQNKLDQIVRDRDVIRGSNIGSEHMRPETLEAIKEISKRQWVAPSGKVENFLSEAEIEQLSITHGTLSSKERDIINNHVSVTIKILESLPYPKNLKNVPFLAGCHHERMNGTGYPRRLTKDQMPLQARMIAIADVFEALTAADRPYKKSMPLSEVLVILGRMKEDNHIDPDLFDVFMHAKIYEQFATQYLDHDALTSIDLTKIPGYKPLE
jgi:HD-GYP domain-containing protein (c-di-GMP phosphodiesterase class II)